MLADFVFGLLALDCASPGTALAKPQVPVVDDWGSDTRLAASTNGCALVMPLPQDKHRKPQAVKLHIDANRHALA